MDNQFPASDGPTTDVNTPKMPQTTEITAETARGLAHRIVEELSERSASDIRLLEIGPVSTIADYFVLCNANTGLHLSGLVDACSDLAPKGVGARVEGRPGDGWMLVDFGAVIVHVFLTDQRSYYAIDELWSDARTLIHVE